MGYGSLNTALSRRFMVISDAGICDPFEFCPLNAIIPSKGSEPGPKNPAGIAG